MLALLSAVFGFLGPFLPELFKWLNKRSDNAHEKEMLGLRLQYAEKEHLWRLEEINARADIAETQAIHQPQKSFGVQLLDAAAGKFPAWALAPVLGVFSIVDFLNGLVRPLVTFAIVGLYVAQKWARFELMKTATGAHFDWAAATARLWDETDYQVLMLVLGFWFGSRLLSKLKAR